MFDFNDKKLRQVPCDQVKSGFVYHKTYAVHCDSCGKPKGHFVRGYKHHLCNSCAQKGETHAVSPEKRKQYPNVNFEDRATQVNSQGAKFSKFKCLCIKCFSDRGYLRPSQFEKPCRSCAQKKWKRGPSPKKGKPTGYTAWNKGLRTSQIPEEHKVLAQRMRTSLRLKLKNRDVAKDGRTFELLGYSVKDLCRSLESKFLPDMSWEDMHKWHVDHITPDSWFCYGSVNDDSFKQSWSLDNLQPMWALDNIKKSNKYAGPFRGEENLNAECQ